MELDIAGDYVCEFETTDGECSEFFCGGGGTGRDHGG
jgi:hypothetical protein